MRLHLALTLLFFMLTLPIWVMSQVDGQKKSMQLVMVSDSFRLDSAVILKGSVSIIQAGLPLMEGVDYWVNYQTGYLFSKTLKLGQPLAISFRTINYPFKKEYAHKDRSIIQPEFRENRNPFLYKLESTSSEVFRNDGLKMNGSLSRGLAFGNNQDVVVNSNLNLQIAGKLNNDIDVLAAISDDNNPIQPEGNTQQIQDFDKVFIQLRKDNTQLTVGDFAMTRPNESYFMNYFKKSRGLQFSSAVNFNKKNKLLFGGEGALSRGRFVRNVLQSIEGNLGPYRLSGINGELYIIIISGTEVVYLDGERLKRGEQNDYVIDYNTGEVTFMPKRVITQYSRIVVEFQYADRNYARSVFHGNTEYQSPLFNLRANYFIEQDSKNQPFLQELNDSNKSLLASVGDNVNRALAPTANATNVFSANKLLYRKIDTLGYSGVYVLASTAGDDSVFYELTFNQVGQGNGDYIQAQSNSNGRVFQWVAPISGVRQGNAAPVTLLISPKSIQMVSIGADVNIIKNTTITVELAQSNYDKNLYATIDKANDIGYGLKVNMSNVLPLVNQGGNSWSIKSNAQYEYVDVNFRNIERYRNVEFDRIWNRQLINQQSTDTGFEEHIVSFRTTLSSEKRGGIYYQFGGYNKVFNFLGIQHLGGANLILGKNRLMGEAEWISTQNSTNTFPSNNEVKRYKAEYSRQLRFITSGLRLEREQSDFKQFSDTLKLGSFAYNQLTIFLNNSDSTRLKYGLSASQREDFQPKNTEFQSASIARSLMGNMEFVQLNSNRLTAHFTYRQFQVIDTILTQLKPEETILARLEYDYSFLKRVFVANTYYQLGSGQELRRDFQYVEVPAGQGLYVWKDFNKDGVQQLNEFQLASFTDKLQANFIRIFLPSNTTVRTNSNQFNQTLNINPNAIWSNTKGIKRFMARWNNQTAFRIDRKTEDLTTLDFFNPFKLTITDTSLISISSLIRNTLFFNRSQPTFGFDLFYQNNKNKSFLTNGFDARERREQGTNIRWNFSSTWGITVGFTFGNRVFNSDFFAANNYNYQFQEIKPRLIYQATQKLRATAVFTYFEGINAAELISQKGSNRELGGELRYTVLKQGVINAKYSMYQVTFDGDIASPLGYDMLQGLAIGNTQIWTLGFQQRLGSNIQININYEGRKSANQKTINIGRMEARYLF